MKRNFLIYFLSMFIMMGFVTLTSCEDDIDTAQPGSKWNTTYVTIHPANYLKPLKPFTLNHSLEQGVSGKIEFPFIVMTSKSAAHDVLVDVECVGTLPVDASKITLSAPRLEIKAGQSKSLPVSLSISDFSELNELIDKQEYELILKVKKITSSEQDIDLGEYNHQIKLKIIKNSAK